MEINASNDYSADVAHDYALYGNKQGFVLKLQGKHVRFVNGRLKLYGDQARELDKLIQTRSQIAVNMHKLDRAAALDVVEQHHAAAIKGGMTSESTSRMRRQAIFASKAAELEAAPNNPEALEELVDVDEIHHGALLETVIVPDVVKSPRLTLRQGK